MSPVSTWLVLVLEAELILVRASFRRGLSRDAALDRAECLLAEANDLERRSQPY